MKTRALIIIVTIASIAGFAIYTSGAFTPLQSDLSECYYTDDENNIPHGYLNEIIVTKKERRPKPPFSKIQSNLYIDYLNFKFADVMSTNPT